MRREEMMIDRSKWCSLLVVVSLILGVSVAVGQAPQTDRPNNGSLAPGEVFGIVGRHVKGSDGGNAGRLWDVLVDKYGEPRAVVIDYGGVLGVGRRKVAIAWKAVKFVPDDAVYPIRLMLTRQQMGAVPSFDYGSVPVTLGDGH
jgi:hypothetical protein